MNGKTIAFAVILVITILLSTGPPVLNAQAGSDYSVNILRVTQIGGWGLVTVNDTFTVRNKATAPLRGMPVGLPRDLATGLRYVAAVDGQKRALSVERDLNAADETYWCNVNFVQDLAYNETYTFTVTSLFTGLLSLSGANFTYKFVTTPTLQVKGESENMTITAIEASKFAIPEGSNLTQTGAEGGPTKVLGYFAPIEPYTAVPLVLNMTSTNQYIVRVPNASRMIKFDPDGKIHVSDTYSFENLAGSVASIPITLPTNSSNAMAYDFIGPLWDAPSQSADLTVSPRYSGGIASNTTFTFTVKYDVDPATYVKEEQWWGSYSFKFSLFSDVKNWIIETLETNLNFPDGLKIRNTNPTLSSNSDTVFKQEYSQAMNDVTPYTDLALAMDYSYSPFWSGTLLLFWVGIIELVAVAIFAVTRLRKPTAAKMPVPTEKLKQFVQLYDGRTALRLELDKMADDLTRGALNKHEYRRRRKTIELRVDEIDRALQPLRQELKELHPRYGDTILRMERAEADIDANRLGEEHFRSQYRAGKISKEAYETAIRDLHRRVDKSKEVVETSLVTLREEAR